MRMTRQVRYWIVVAILMLGFCGASALMLAELRRDSWTMANAGACNLLTVLSQDIEATIRTYDRTLTAVASKLRTPELARLDPPLQQAFLFEGALVEPYFTSLLVLDAQGDVVRDAGAFPPRSDNFADRGYFQVHARGDTAGLYISTPFERRLTGSDMVLGISRRIEAPDGTFAGVVVGTLRLGYFRALFERAQLKPGDAINLLSQDGILLMRSPDLPGQIGRDLSGTANMRRFQAVRSGNFSGVAAVDGVSRVYNFTRPGDLPLILNVALERDGIFAAWRNQAIVMAVILAFLCLLTLALGFLVRREFERRSRADTMRRRSEAQYRLLADNATDLILRLDGDLTRRYVSPASLAMLGYRPEELIGGTPQELIHPDDWPLVKEMVQRTRTTRSGAETVYRLKHRDGRHVWVEGRYNFVEEDDGFIVVLRDVSQRKSAEQSLAAAHAELARRADTDGLTGLFNRRRFDEALSEELERAARAGTGAETARKAPVSLLLIDVDRFKLFNDAYGHPAGDACLRRVAEAIEGCIRSSDICARYGGEEIAVILPASDEACARRAGERIRGAVEALDIAHERSESGRVTISIGCTTANGAGGETAAELVERADRLLYEAKRTGRNRVSSDTMIEVAIEPLGIESEAARLAAVDAFDQAVARKGGARLDLIAQNAAQLFGAPIGFVSLVGQDELTLVGRYGIETRTVPRGIAFCAHTIVGNEPLVVSDTAADLRFRDNPLAQGENGLRFYAGAPIVDPASGETVGAVCVADTQPRGTVTAADRQTLKGLTGLVTAELATDEQA